MLKQNRLLEMKKIYNTSVGNHKRSLSRKSINEKDKTAQFNNQRLQDLISKSKKRKKMNNIFQNLENKARNCTIEGRSNNKNLQNKLKLFEKHRKTFFANSFKVNYLEKGKMPSKKENINFKKHFLKISNLKKKRKTLNNIKINDVVLKSLKNNQK